MPKRNSYGSDLNNLFAPKSVAVIGASNIPGKVGYAIVQNLIDADFAGQIYPINLKEKKVQGLQAYDSVLKVRAPIDVAIIVVPAQIVPSVMKECAKKKIENAIIITAGFAETGEEGKKLQEELKEIVEKNKMNVVGPNTLGVINTENGFNGSFSSTFPEQGSIALVSQSGALCTAILDWARQEKIGFSKFISTGNKAFMCEANYFSYLANDPRTKAVFVYMESVCRAPEFLEAAHKLAKKKPVVVLKAGRSPEGMKAASSHTGALSVDDDLFSVACKKANIIRVNSIEGFFDLAKVLSKMKKFSGFNLAVVTNAGGPGVIAADSASKHKFKLPQLSTKTLETVKKINPHASNPLDLIGDAQPIDYRTALKVLQSDSGIDLVYALLTPQSMTNPERVADIVIELNKKKPIICSFLGGTSVSHPRKYLRENGVVEFETPERGIKALSRLQDYFEGKEKTPVFAQPVSGKKEIHEMLAGKKQLSMEESFALLKEAGIATAKTIFVSKAEEILEHFANMQFPVVVKAAVGLPHKTDYGLVKANVGTRVELAQEIERMSAKLSELGYKPRFAVQEMVSGQEVLVSAITNTFGKVITYGLGGIFVEIMKDVSQKIAPLTDADVEEMLSEVKGTKVLMGYRTKKKFDVEALRKAIKALSELVVTYPEISEIEMNPVMVSENGAVAVDAIVSLQ